MANSILLITPPFTQLNTPYPATAYLKGFLNTKGIDSEQIDLGIEVILHLFSKSGLEKMFLAATENVLANRSENILLIEKNKQTYINTIDAVISFLQGKQATLAHLIASSNFLPRAQRFAIMQDTDWAFGSMGVQDKAKFMGTMYLEDLSDFIKECVDEHFGFSRYAERLARSANSFDALHHALQAKYSYIDELTISILNKKMAEQAPALVCFSVPFPGNVFSAFRSAQFIKNNYPNTKIALGGGFANTELRDLSDERVMQYFDFITLDDGEICLENLWLYIHGKLLPENLVRTFYRHDNQLMYNNVGIYKDYKQEKLGTPDYNGLPLQKYISAIEIINPMHRLWTDGRWNKLTMAHGCYWGKCTFCDISLDYIKRYEPATAKIIVDRMEQLIASTGETGFHFVDEAAPPALMRAVAQEIITRKLIVSWWANIRFEKSFTADLCILLKASGCIGVSGGLEVASDRLLELIKKGVTVAQVAVVNKNFTDAGIMVHAYLMYGFPTQSAQEIIDSLEMVRQMFANGIMQSGFWHRFASTVHSPVGMHPEEFGVRNKTDKKGSFANNDLEHIDSLGADFDLYGDGLKKSLFNYMHGVGMHEPLQKWFDCKVPNTTVAKGHILDCIQTNVVKHNGHAKLLYIGNSLPDIKYFTKSKKGMQREMALLGFATLDGLIELQMEAMNAKFLVHILQQLMQGSSINYAELQHQYTDAQLSDFELWWFNKPMNAIAQCGLLVI